MSDEPRSIWEETSEDAALPGDPGVDWEDDDEADVEEHKRTTSDQETREEVESQELPLDLDA